MSKSKKRNKNSRSNNRLDIKQDNSINIHKQSAPDEGGVVPDNSYLRIPDEEEENRAESVLSELAFDSVRSHYTFINLCALVMIFLGIGLTLLLMRETERYGEDSIQLTKESFIDGSYTGSLSSKYTGELRLDGIIGKLSSLTRYVYGFSGSDIHAPISPDPLTPDIIYPSEGSTTTSYTTTSSITTSASQIVSVDPSFTGTPVTMPTVTFTVEPEHTGYDSNTTTSLTSSFTTTGPYSPTATAPPSISSEVTEPPTESSATDISSETETPPTSSEAEVTPTETAEPTVTTPPEVTPAPDPAAPAV